MRKPTSKLFRPTFEALTDRLAPAAFVNANADLQIDVGDGDDTVTVRRVLLGTTKTAATAAYRVVENGATTDIPVARVTGGDVVFRGNGGNDRFINNTGLRATANGGPGSDTLTGGSGDDFLDGGLGADYLYGNGGDDRLFAANGSADPSRNFLDGGDGNDTINGGDGPDEVDAGGGNDLVYGFGGDDRLSGGGGIDFLAGGVGNDALSGGEGNDYLYGGGGDDTLHGGGGVDRLYGEGGNDGLFAGLGDGAEALRGGDGFDRFLIPANQAGTPEDTIDDRSATDARIVFRDSPALTGKKFTGQDGEHSFDAGAWTNFDVERVDVALANLHRHVGNTRLLKTAGKGEMSFLAVGRQTSSGFQSGGWNSGTQIAFVDLPLIPTTFLQRTVYHEFGHNWDETDENGHVNDFRAVSGWTPWHAFMGSPPPTLTASSGVGDIWYYATAAAGTFAREYGKTNPLEDMATTWEAYFVNAYHGGAAGLAAEGLTRSDAKWATLDALFDQARATP